MAYLTYFSFELFYEIFTEDASLLFLYHGTKKSKMTKNSDQGGGGGGPALKLYNSFVLSTVPGTVDTHFLLPLLSDEESR